VGRLDPKLLGPAASTRSKIIGSCCQPDQTVNVTQGVCLLGLATQPYSISLGMAAQPNPTSLEGVGSCLCRTK